MLKSALPYKILLKTLIFLSFIVLLPSCRYFRERGIFNGREIKKAMLQIKQDSTRTASSANNLQLNLSRTEEPTHESVQVSEEYIISPAGSDKEKSGTVSNKAKTVSNKSKYYIIVGTFSQADNANSRKRKYDNMGYSTSLIEGINKSGKNVILVSVRSGNDPDEADKILEKIQKEVDSAAWLYIAK